MNQYLELVKRVLKDGERHENRTGIDTIRVDGEMMKFDLREGFPAMTTKKLPFKAVIGELCAFLRSSKSAADFRALDCGVWDQNANENKDWLANPFRKGTDDLGPVYGVQWRKWPAFKVLPDPWGKDGLEGDRRYHECQKKLEEAGWAEIGRANEIYDGYQDLNSPIYYKEIDQLGDCIRTIIKNPDSRRILFHGWNPAVLDEVALPSCHLLYQFLPNKNTKELSMTLYLRSNDIFLGNPFNVAEAGALQSLVAHLTGYTVKTLTVFITDCHIYMNHMDAIHQQLEREPMAPPKLVINDRVPSYDLADNTKFMDESGDTQIDHLIEWLELVEPSDFVLEGYESHPAIRAPMAV